MKSKIISFIFFILIKSLFLLIFLSVLFLLTSLINRIVVVWFNLYYDTNDDEFDISLAWYVSILNSGIVG